MYYYITCVGRHADGILQYAYATGILWSPGPDVVEYVHFNFESGPANAVTSNLWYA